MLAIAIAVAALVAAATLYFAVKSMDFRKFLAGAFFVSAGTQLYLFGQTRPRPAQRREAPSGSPGLSAIVDATSWTSCTR